MTRVDTLLPSSILLAGFGTAWSHDGSSHCSGRRAGSLAASLPARRLVFHPAELPSGFTRFECTFPNTVAVPGPNAACQETQWGNSGIYRQVIRDLVVNGPGAQELCDGPAHFDVIRVCSLAWIDNPETPWGDAGPVGCVVATEPVLICGVA